MRSLLMSRLNGAKRIELPLFPELSAVCGGFVFVLVQGGPQYPSLVATSNAVRFSCKRIESVITRIQLRPVTASSEATAPKSFRRSGAGWTNIAEARNRLTSSPTHSSVTETAPLANSILIPSTVFSKPERLSTRPALRAIMSWAASCMERASSLSSSQSDSTTTSATSSTARASIDFVERRRMPEILHSTSVKTTIGIWQRTAVRSGETVERRTPGEHVFPPSASTSSG